MLQAFQSEKKKGIGQISKKILSGEPAEVVSPARAILTVRSEIGPYRRGSQTLGLAGEFWCLNLRRSQTGKQTNTLFQPVQIESSPRSRLWVAL
jgi:hypothetical protein